MERNRRLALWEITPGMHCSVVGTCLAPADVRAIMRKCKLAVEPGAADYRVHGFLVNEAARPGPVGRAIGALLDKKYAGAIRQSLRLGDDSAIEAYWGEACRRGAIAGPYWALLSLADLPQEIGTRVFGDVHMLGHFMSGANRDAKSALWAAEQRIEALTGRLQKVRGRAHERDLALQARIDVLETELAMLRATQAACQPPAVAPPTPAAGRAGRLERRLERQGRKLTAVRAQLTQERAENARLRARLEQPAPLPPLAASLRDPAPLGRSAGQPAACRIAVMRCLLYVGGRRSAVPHLKAGAARHAVELLHHDGGIEENVVLLDQLVPQADVVFCPVDCVSHSASLRARALCRRHAKPFVPLRNASASCFCRQVADLASSPTSEQQ